MARGVNVIHLLGNVGNEPDVKYTQGGTCITRVSLATTSVRKDRDGNTQEKTEWHRVVMFGKLAEIAGEYLRKGSSVYFQGRVSYSEMTGDDGQKKYFTDIVAEEMQMVGGRGEGGGQGDGGGQSRGSGGGGGGGQQQRSNNNRQQGQNQGQNRPAPQQRQAPPPPPMDDFADDDIPFDLP